jgi:hypothetical protein
MGILEAKMPTRSYITVQEEIEEKTITPRKNEVIL